MIVILRRMVTASRARLGAVLVLLAAGSGCSLLTSLDGLSGTDADAGTTTVNEGGARDDATTDGGAEATTDATTDGGAEATTKYAFTDDFNRPDTTGGLGNGWKEKLVGLRLAGGEAECFNTGSGDYRDTIASRPSSETVGDVEASVEFRFKVGGGGYVQVHARVQTATVSQPGVLDSYVLFRNLNVADGKTFTIARQRNNDIFTSLRDFQASSSIDTSIKYRMRLRVTGTSPVELAAVVEREAGAGWTELASTTFSDTAGNRITSPGVVGISGGNDPTGVFAYDNFSAQGL